MTYLLLAIIFFLLLAMVLSAVVTPLPPTCQHDYELSKNRRTNRFALGRSQ